VSVQRRPTSPPNLSVHTPAPQQQPLLERLTARSLSTHMNTCPHLLFQMLPAVARHTAVHIHRYLLLPVPVTRFSREPPVRPGSSACCVA
jgi:hypothetical protein